MFSRRRSKCLLACFSRQLAYQMMSIHNRYDVYLFIGCRTLPELDDLIQKVPALADPTVQKRILQRSPGPGFLSLDLTSDVATPLLKLLKSRQANGYVVLADYRRPRITPAQAASIARCAIAELHATRIPDHTLGPVHLVREEPVCWTYAAASEEWVKQGCIPGMLFASIDKLDGHVWQPEEFERLRGEG
jgi:hypothetical protein